jgi:hypothetical protein
MPFDHAASFELKGVPGNIVQDVINISSDASFVAVAIGYGFEEDRARSADLGPFTATNTNEFLPGDVTLSQIPTAALIEGFRLNPSLDRLIFDDTGQIVNGRRVVPRDRTFSTKPIPLTLANSIIERVKPPEDISFLFSILDSGTGRELQDEPIHNLASLGKSNGDRPFRMLAQPLTFQPRSTIRLQIVERAEGVQGTLFIVLYGYKIFGGGAVGNSSVSAASLANASSSRVVPFDYVSKFQLTGTPGNQVEDEVPVNVDGGFVATSIGYGLSIETLDAPITGDFFLTGGPRPTTSLGNVRLKNLPTGALQDGIRIRPNFVRIAFTNGGLLEPSFPIDLFDRVFERLNRPDDVSFRYSIFDTGTGRELQNEPINNIAGLGIANGDRPFKRLARPMIFQPRSTIRVTVEEQFGRGVLFIVFQGYKVLNGPTAAPAPTSAPRQRRSTRR